MKKCPCLIQLQISYDNQRQNQIYLPRFSFPYYFDGLNIYMRYASPPFTIFLNDSLHLWPDLNKQPFILLFILPNLFNISLHQIIYKKYIIFFNWMCNLTKVKNKQTRNLYKWRKHGIHIFQDKNELVNTEIKEISYHLNALRGCRKFFIFWSKIQAILRN